MAVELAELIEQLRSELTSAMHSGDGADVQFEVGAVELELTIQVEKAATPGAKIRFWVVEAAPMSSLGPQHPGSSSSLTRAAPGRPPAH